MKTTCLIDTYNYAQYLGRAIDSALEQTRPFDEIVVIDDGSEDETDQVLEHYRKTEAVRIVQKKNGGQLSAFQRGFEVSQGDLICFLDADDMYQPRYLERVLQVFGQYPEVDYVFCDSVVIDGDDRVKGCRQRYAAARDIYFGRTVGKTKILHSWTGNSTSMNAVRREILEKVFPLDMEEDFRLNADHPIVLGSSVAGARKYYLHEGLVKYRIHGKNLWMGKKRQKTDEEKNAWFQLVDRMMDAVMEKNGIEVDDWVRFLVDEYTDTQPKTNRETLVYLYAIWKTDQGVFSRMAGMAKILFRRLVA